MAGGAYRRCSPVGERLAIDQSVPRNSTYRARSRAHLDRADI